MAGAHPSTLLLDYTTDKVTVLDEEGTFTYVNASTEELLGFDPSTLRGENAFEYVHPDDREEVRAKFERVIDADDEYVDGTATYRHRTSDGTWVWLESRMSNVTDDALDGYVVSSRDVTDRVVAEQRLDEITTTTDEVLWMFDGDWSELLFCNPAVEELYGVTVDDLKSDPTLFLSCIHPDDIEAVTEAMERLSDGESVEIEYRVQTETEQDNWVWVRGEPIAERPGEVTRIVGFTRDITSRKRRERQLVVMDNLLRHNLRNDLNIILGNLELIEGHVDADVEDRTAVIRCAGEGLLESAEKQHEIIELLTKPLAPERFDVGAVARDALEAVKRQHPEATVDFDADEGCGVYALEEVEVAILELVENAIVHADDPSPHVGVRVERTDGAVELTVVDDARPIPEDEYQFLTRGDEMTAVYHTTGLGLWLVYWIVELSNGEIRFERREDGGNRVVVTFAAAE